MALQIVVKFLTSLPGASSRDSLSRSAHHAVDLVLYAQYVSRTLHYTCYHDKKASIIILHLLNVHLLVTELISDLHVLCLLYCFPK